MDERQLWRILRYSANNSNGLRHIGLHYTFRSHAFRRTGTQGKNNKSTEITESSINVQVIGAGLAGAEAALQLAENGIRTDLYEMRPEKKTGAHKTNDFAELVCSNEFSKDILFDELEKLGSILIKTAQKSGTLQNKTLFINKEAFQHEITAQINKHPNINIIHKEVQNIDPSLPTIIATGPLTSKSLCDNIIRLVQKENFSFFGAPEPIIDAATIDLSTALKNENGANIILPFTKTEFADFYGKLKSAQKIERKRFEDTLKFLETNPPIEDIASNGSEALRAQLLHLKGSTAEEVYAAITLQYDALKPNMLRLRGFKTNLRWGAQKELIHSIRALEQADILMYGLIHKNTFVNSPKLLSTTLQSKEYPNIFFAGQITGTDGYIEAIATGFLAGKNMASFVSKQKPLVLKKNSMLNALTAYISYPKHESFQPISANRGLL